MLNKIKKQKKALQLYINKIDGTLREEHAKLDHVSKLQPQKRKPHGQDFVYKEVDDLGRKKGDLQYQEVKGPKGKLSKLQKKRQKEKKESYHIDIYPA